MLSDYKIELRRDVSLIQQIALHSVCRPLLDPDARVNVRFRWVKRTKRSRTYDDIWRMHVNEQIERGADPEAFGEDLTFT